jgi:hypothetical protein
MEGGSWSGILERTSEAQVRGPGPWLTQHLRQVVAVEPASAGGAVEEVFDPEVGGRDADGEAEVVSGAGDLDYVEPEEEDLDGDALEVGDAVGGYRAGDPGLVAERVGPLDGELADGVAGAGRRGVERGGEGAGGVVEGVGDHALREDARGEVELRQRLVRRRLGGGGGGGGGEQEKEGEEAAVGEHGGVGRLVALLCFSETEVKEMDGFLWK